MFEIANSNGTYASAPTTLASFTTATSPTGGLIDAPNGTLIGTSLDGGTKNQGQVFEIPQSAPEIFAATGTIETFVAPVAGNYQITALGAQGGNSAFAGGDGASVADTFALTAGETLQILVGEAGGNSTGAGAGGGGASYVVGPGATPLLIAAGGGGGYLTGAGGVGTTVQTGSESGGFASISGGGGGGGAISDGQTAPFQILGFGSSTETASPGGGLSFADGGTGGIGLPPSVGASFPNPADPGSGGFGGAGGGGLFGGGGGGGYNGGSGGFAVGYGSADYTASTGGTSYDASANPVVVEGENAGNGMVIIQGPTEAATALVSFTSTGGAVYPYAGLITDAAGDLFGTTSGGGVLGSPATNNGTVFEIKNSSTGLATTATTLLTFNGTSNGKTPIGNLTLDAAGDLFGTTSAGGANSDGTIFEIKNLSTGYAAAPITLLSFNGTNGSTPEGALTIDANGDLFGTTFKGGTANDGTVFELANTSTGYATAPTTLTTFTGSNGANPAGALITDATGDLFGSTQAGGANNDGSEFEITNSGFVTATAVTIALATDTGLSATDDVTTNPALTGTGSANATVTLTEGTTTLGTTVANASGVWTFTPTLANGTQTVVASESNAASTKSASLTFTLSTATPDLPNITQILGDGSSILVTGTADPGDLVSLYNGTSLLGTATASAAENGEWDISVSTSLPQAKDSLTATAESRSGIASGNSTPAFLLQAGYTSSTPLSFGDGNNVVDDASSVSDLIFRNGNDIVTSAGDGKTFVFGSGTDQLGINSSALNAWQRNWVSIDGSSSVTAQGNWNQVAVGASGSGGTTTFNGSNNALSMLATQSYAASDTAASNANEFHLFGGNANLTLAGSDDMVFMSEGSADNVTDNGTFMQLFVNGDAGDITINDWANDPHASLQLMNWAGFATAQAVLAALTPDGFGGTQLTLPKTGNTIDFADTAAAFIHLNQISVAYSWSGGHSGIGQ